jgi:hypothetical protein
MLDGRERSLLSFLPPLLGLDSTDGRAYVRHGALARLNRRD